MLDFKLPEVGENIERGNIVSIAVAVGDTVKKDQDLLELETDKASVPVPSPVDGVIKEILVAEGQDVAIGSVVMKIEEGASGSPAAKKAEPQAPAATKAAPTPKPAAPKPAAQPAPAKAKGPQKHVPAAPSVRRFAREIGIDIAQVPGTGRGGRISMDDVKTYAKALKAARTQPYKAATRELAAALAIENKDLDAAREHISALVLLEPDRELHRRRLEALGRLGTK